MGDIGSTVLLFAVMGGALYFLMIRPQQKRQKEQQKLMNSLEPGVRVMLISGIFATIKHVGDKQAVVEIAPGVEMTVDKRAISPQPVVDEFEYEDDDAPESADSVEADQAERDVEAAADLQGDESDTEKPAEPADVDDSPAAETDEAVAAATDGEPDSPGSAKAEKN